jgi:hypothetical protein
VAPVLIALAAAELIWSRFIMLPQGLWGDEAYSVFTYVHGGPRLIWNAAKWIPNNHMMFEFLTWATNGILGVNFEPSDRLWSVFPAIAGGALMTWWLWKRINPWTAAIFAVLATISPLYFDLGVQARGYGLGFLASVVILIAADRLAYTGSRSALVWLGVGGFVGMATLQDFLPQFLATAAVLVLLVPSVRRPVVVAVICTGAATLAWYAPVLSKVIGYQNPYGISLPWYGFVTAPLHDIFGQDIHSLERWVSVTAGAIVAACVLAGGAGELWRRRERRLVALIVVPVVATYLTIEVSTGYLPRFVSFVVMPLLALTAIGIGGLGHQIARSRRLTVPLVAVLIVCSLLALGRFVRYAAVFAQVPYESAKTAGQILRGIGPPAATGPVVTNYALGAFRDYAAPHHMQTLGAARLVQLFCSYPARFVFYDQALFPPHPNTSCLVQRGSFQIALSERRSRVSVWLVPALTRSTSSSTAAAAAARRRSAAAKLDGAGRHRAGK